MPEAGKGVYKDDALMLVRAVRKEHHLHVKAMLQMQARVCRGGECMIGTGSEVLI